jgi:hypothetical protein
MLNEMFRKLVEARDRLLAALGTKERPPNPPDFPRKGVRAVYRVGKPAQPRPRLGNRTARLA